MRIYVALIRGINVGGKGVLPMRVLKTVLEGLGCSHITTYVQSGNAVFEIGEKDASQLSVRIASAIQTCRGFEPHVLLLKREDVEQAIAANPFPEAISDPKNLHLGFLARIPAIPDLKTLTRLASTRERFRLIGRVFYLHAPDGVGKSKLAAGAEKCLGVPMTDRNWRTVSTLLEIATGGSRSS
jgi:uncharacterized protein (DUF1697 family)